MFLLKKKKKAKKLNCFDLRNLLVYEKYSNLYNALHLKKKKKAHCPDILKLRLYMSNDQMEVNLI